MTPPPGRGHRHVADLVHRDSVPAIPRSWGAYHHRVPFGGEITLPGPVQMTLAPGEF